MKGISGKFVVRMTPELHRRLRDEAARQALSLNSLCVEFLAGGLERGGRESTREQYASAVSRIKKRFGNDFMGLFLFGSQVTGMATEFSDVDFLIVLDRRVPLDRSLYRWWDETIFGKAGREWSPQFVHIPKKTEDAGGIWLEAALASQKIWEKGRKVSAFLEELRSLIRDGRVRRHLHQGQPYWVWRPVGEAA